MKIGYEERARRSRWWMRRRFATSRRLAVKRCSPADFICGGAGAARGGDRRPDGREMCSTVTKLDRLARSMWDLLRIVNGSGQRGWPSHIGDGPRHHDADGAAHAPDAGAVASSNGQ